MKRKIIRLMSATLCALMLAGVFASVSPEAAYAEIIDDDPIVVVSMGDSFSSGEGIEPFYGQDKSVPDKVKDHDWLAHRSTKSWGGRLEVGSSGSMSDHRKTVPSGAPVQWYFTAVSGAETKHIDVEGCNQIKEYCRIDRTNLELEKGTETLPLQIEIFDQISDNVQVDYVTITIGGNDAGFSDIIMDCAVFNSNIYWGKSSKLEDDLEASWAKIDRIRNDLTRLYHVVQRAAGPQAAIIVAGYPHLLDPNGCGAVIESTEAWMVNRKISQFNDEIEKLVNSLRMNSGLNIHFVSVEEAFEGHEAYTSESYINDIEIILHEQDIDNRALASSYSMHPNTIGAQQYADCVNAKIREIEESKKLGTLSGRVAKASEHTAPIPGAMIEVFYPNSMHSEVLYSNDDGHYQTNLPEGIYPVSITADGYIPFSAMAEVKGDEVTYMQTFLMVAGQEGQRGVASGKITNAVTGVGIGDVLLEVRTGWNYTEGETVASVYTDANGNYSLDLPLGNYSLYALKEGFVLGVTNIVVQNGTTANQNGSIAPELLGDDYRIVLTWGSEPADMDAHLYTAKEAHIGYHVSFNNKEASVGGKLVCSLDVDNENGYGPETITLKTFDGNTYYYYVHQYVGDKGAMKTSAVQVNVYQGNWLIKTFNVPTDQTDDYYWNVFAIRDGQLIVSNTFTPYPDTGYASASPFSLRAPAPSAEEIIDPAADVENNPKESAPEA